MSDKIKVNVSIEGKYRVQGTVEMTREQYDALGKRLDDGPRGYEREQLAEEIAMAAGFDIGSDGDIDHLEVEDFIEI
jgi:hypothetical protein